MTTEQVTYIAEIMALTERQIKLNTGLDVRLIAKAHPLLSNAFSDPRDLVVTVAEAIGYKLPMLIERSRKTEVVKARFVCVYFAKRFFPKVSTVALGKLFELDHSYVNYAIKSVEELLDAKDELFIGLYAKAKKAADAWFDNYKEEVLDGEA